MPENPKTTPDTAAAPSSAESIHGAATSPLTEEERRIEDARQQHVHWNRWGPFLSERQWGTVREDYSPDGDAWGYFPHDHARSRVYRWGEDGIAGICDRHQRICFSIALWNEKDSILKERLFGLTNREGNHGEDVKECYYYLDATPTSSYLKYLYKYPHAAFPYDQLVQENAKRSRKDPEYELVDTGIFRDSRYFDVFVEYAKADAEDILIRITAYNRGPDAARLHILPTLWFRNKWSWGGSAQGDARPNVRRSIRLNSEAADVLEITHPEYVKRWLIAEGAAELLFTENETNMERLFKQRNSSRYVKDAFHTYLCAGRRDAVNPTQTGTKAAAHYAFTIAPGGSASVRLRLIDKKPAANSTTANGTSTGPFFGTGFDSIFAQRIQEADEFYRKHTCTETNKELSEDARNVQRQAFAGLIWNRQSYHYEVRRWLEGDPTQPPPAPSRRYGRNSAWTHLYNSDEISMPDKWEYPWYASWDLAFHCVATALIDPDFAKRQLILLLREWYMHPNGQIPAYEWNFSDVNPPVHAWAAWRVYRIEGRLRGKPDRLFLQRVFHKLLLNFTWWVNRKDPDGMNVFEGGFLGLDNIGVFDRSKPLIADASVSQSDGTSWMAMFCLNMLAMAIELAHDDPAYEDVASKFFEHFVYIAEAMNAMGEDEVGLWDDADGFYYDALRLKSGQHVPLKVRSMVGLIPLFAVETFEPGDLRGLAPFRRRAQWFLDHHPELAEHIDMSQRSPEGIRTLIGIVDRQKLERILRYVLSEDEFLSPHGIRSLSKFHSLHPFVLQFDGIEHSVDYEPAESATDMFGGNSNWRGPLWFPVNFLLIEALQRYHFYYKDDLQVEFPTGSGQRKNLWEVARELSRRLSGLFLRKDGKRAAYGNAEMFQSDPYWKDLISFYEFFNGDTGEGLGANHQTGWTALVAKLLEQSGE